MPSVLTCPRCGHPLPSDAPRGLGPLCLLKGDSDDGPEMIIESDARPGQWAGVDAGHPRRATRSQAWKDLCETVTWRSADLDPPRRGVEQRGAVSIPAVDLDQFVTSLIQVRLMERVDVQGFLERYASHSRPREADHLARELVRARRLTEYQAGALLQGKSRGLAIGNYLILDKLGRGGMGLVFKAQHRRMKRFVALKVLPPSYAKDESAVSRFQREAEAVARLGHPNIVAALDADEIDGLHFFAMEYVEGSDLARLVVAKGPFPVAQAIDCLMQAARGLKAAHDKGIYHRDIKPSNLMLDSGGTVKILDLGLARMEKEADLFGSPESDAGLTRTGALMGTVGFMPPEQAYNAKDADHRSDIYSLGCTLYFLLTGRPPYSGVTRMACLLAHREQPIPLLRDARPEVPPRLDATLRRMMAKGPEDRHQSIDALIADLEACRVADPAGPPGPVPITPDPVDPKAAVRSWSGRHPPWRRLALVLTGACLASALAVTVFDRRRASSREPVVKGVGPTVGPISKRRVPPRETTNREPQPPREEPPPIEAVGEVRRFQGHEDPRVEGIAVSTNGKQALSAGHDRKVRRWDVATGREIRPAFVHDGPVLSVAFSPDGVSALSGGRDRTMRLWDVQTGQEIGRFEGHEKPIHSVAFSPDGRRALSGSGDKTVRLWDVATLTEIDRRDHEGLVTAVAFSPDGQQALSGSEDRTVRLWDLGGARGKAIRRLEAPAAVWCVAFSPRGHRALSGGPDGALSYWNLDGGPEPLIRRFEGHGDWVRCVSFLPDGRHAVAGTEAGKLIVWDLEEGSEVRPPLRVPARHLGVAVLPDGFHALTSNDDGFVRYWRLPELPGPVGPPEGDPMVPGP